MKKLSTAFPGARRKCLVLPVCILVLAVACASSGPREEFMRETLKSYRSMRVGDWTFYDMTEAIGVFLQVMEIHDDRVVIKRRGYFNGKPAHGSFSLEYRFDDIERNLSAGRDLTGKIEISPPEITRDTVEAAGQTFNCVVYTVKTPGAEISTYVSEAVPLDGVVMVKRNGRIVRKLKAFGRAGEPLTIPTRPEVKSL